MGVKCWNEYNVTLAGGIGQPKKEENIPSASFPSQQWEYTLYHPEYLTRAETKFNNMIVKFGVIKVFSEKEKSNFEQRGFLFLKKTEVNDE